MTRLRQENMCHHVWVGWVRRYSHCIKATWKTKIKFRENVVDEFPRESTIDQVFRRYIVTKNVKNKFFSGVIFRLRYCNSVSQVNVRSTYKFEIDAQDSPGRT